MHYESDVLDDYLSHELAPEVDAAVHAHLEACADCRAAHAQAVALRDWIRAAAQAEEREMPAGISARVWAQIRTPAPTMLDRVRALWRPLVAIPVGALAVGLAFAFGPLRPATRRRSASPPRTTSTHTTPRQRRTRLPIAAP